MHTHTLTHMYTQIPSHTATYIQTQTAHTHIKMQKNEHKPGNMAVLVSAQRIGLRTFEDVLELSD